MPNTESQQAEIDLLIKLREGDFENEAQPPRARVGTVPGFRKAK